MDKLFFEFIYQMVLQNFFKNENGIIKMESIRYTDKRNTILKKIKLFRRSTRLKILLFP